MDITREEFEAAIEKLTPKPEVKYDNRNQNRKGNKNGKSSF